MKHFLTNQLVPSRALYCPILAAIISLTILSASRTNAAGVFSYSLTTPNDPVSPGHVLEYDATVTNLTAGTQSVRLDFKVPKYTTYGGSGAGTARFYDFGTVAPGASETAKLLFAVVGSGTIPPNGTPIKLTVTDTARQVPVSRTAIVQSKPALNLQLSSEQGTVAPGGKFTYTLATANLSGSSLPGTTLKAKVPKGASFVSADSGGVLNAGTVTWSLGTLPVGANVQVHATFQASSSPNTPLGPLDASATDTAAHIASASDTRVVYSAPFFSYTLTAVPDPVSPGHILEYDATVTNLTASTQSVRLDFTVPEYTTYGGSGAGTARFYDFGTVAPGASETAKLLFAVVGSGTIPRNGTSITLNAIDVARGASISRTAVVEAAPALNLQLSSEQGTVAPGGKFTYTFATANLSGGSLAGATLRASLPAGASFVSADSGGVLNAGTVTWSLGTLPVGANVQVHAIFQASSSPNTPLGPLDAIASDTAGHIARASDTRVVYSAPFFSYTLTAVPDPASPGHVLEYDATVRNLTAGTQSVRLDFTVPEYTTYGGSGAGTARFYDFGTVAPGASETAKLLFAVVGSGTIPRNGTSITLNAIDVARGASISRTAVVEAAPALNLQLSSEQGTVAPGGKFTYTLATANLSGSSLAGTTLSATLPAGATFVSADTGGTLTGGAVTWNLGTLPVGANVQVHAIFQASSSPNTPLGPLDAIAADTAGHIARASDTRVVYAAPFFSYTLTAVPDPASPGHVLEYDATVRNLTAGTQSVRLDFTVPEYTTYGGSGAGTARFYDFGTVAPGASETAKLLFAVVGSGTIPPNGTSITLNAIDVARGASISRTAVVEAAPALNLQLSSEQGTVAPGGKFTYTLATANLSGSSLAGTTLSATLPAGATFVSADTGGTLTGGAVTWNLGTLPVGANVQVHATFQASSSPNAPLGPLDAIAADTAGHIARASDTRVVYAAPVFRYSVTATPDPVAPGHVLEYDVTVTNLTAGTQSVRLDFTVPEYTTYGGSGAGTARFYDFGTVAPRASETARLLFNVLASGPTPPHGASITLCPLDVARGASISRTVVVK